MRVTEMTLSCGVVDIGEDAGWVTREFTGGVKVSATVKDVDPLNFTDVFAACRASIIQQIEAYR